jgi:hypothetical protein
MFSCKKLFVSVLLLTLVLSQTNFKNTCQNSSLLPLLATGVINLNPLDTYNNGANKDYYQDLSLAQFQTVDVLGYAFALSGFQAPCAQAFYTLVVDKVNFENQNTRMRIVVNYLNPSTFGTSTKITQWNLVTFTYIVVSRNFQGAFSNIWATTSEASISTPLGGAPIDDKTGIFANGPNGNCLVYTDPNYNLQNNPCDPTFAWSAAAQPGGRLITHAYIMGFQWNSNRSTTSFLSASAYGTNIDPAALDSSDE